MLASKISTIEFRFGSFYAGSVWGDFDLCEWSYFSAKGDIYNSKIESRLFLKMRQLVICSLANCICLFSSVTRKPWLLKSTMLWRCAFFSWASRSSSFSHFRRYFFFWIFWTKPDMNSDVYLPKTNKRKTIVTSMAKLLASCLLWICKWIEIRTNAYEVWISKKAYLS